MVRTSLVAALVAVPWTVAASQEPAPAEPTLTQAIYRAQPRKYLDPECGIKPGHFRVRGAAVYLVTATDDEGANRDRLLGDAHKTLEEAIVDNDQGDNAAAWYILGRVNLYQGDVVGADSTLAKAEALAPECHEEITRIRRNTWIPLRQRALLQLRNEQPDSAIATYRLGVTIYRGEPDVFYVMATMFDSQNLTDSVQVYLQKTIAIANPTNEEHERQRLVALRRLAGIYAGKGQTDSAAASLTTLTQAAEANHDTAQWVSAVAQLGRILFEAKRYDAALVAFRQMQRLKPDDESVTRNIATVFQAAGQVDSAQAVLAKLGGGTTQIDTTSARFLINRGAGRYQAKDYAEAAADFRRAAEVEPSNRIALFNLGLAYNELKNGPKLIETAKRLVAREPLHEMSHRLLVQGYVFGEDQTNARLAVNRLDGLPMVVDSLTITPAAGTMTITGAVMARKRAVTAATLVFEFLGADGTVITTSRVAVPALDPGASHAFSVAGTGDGIVDWRYRL